MSRSSLHALKRAKLVTTERDGLHVVYSIAGTDVAALLVQLQAVAAQHIAGLEKLTREFFGGRDGLEAIDRDTLLERLRASDAVLVDVRPEHEFEAGHLPGGLSVPLSALESRLGDLPRDRTIVAYCRGPFCTLSLLVLAHAFVGAMVGMERSILPAIAEDEFQLAARTAILSFIVVFGVTKALTNYFAGRWSDRFGRKAVLIAGWLVAAPVPFLLMWALSCGLGFSAPTCCSVSARG